MGFIWDRRDINTTYDPRTIRYTKDNLSSASVRKRGYCFNAFLNLLLFKRLLEFQIASLSACYPQGAIRKLCEA